MNHNPKPRPSTVLSANDAEHAINAQTGCRSTHAAHAEIERIKAAPDSPAHWEADHPEAREQLQAAEHAFNEAVDRQAAREIENPREHLTRVLGERPARALAAEREAWDHGARAIERYRAAYNIDPSEPTALGAEPQRPRGGYDQLREWRAAGRHALEARERLGIARPGLGPIEERLARTAGVVPEQDIQCVREFGHER